ncbi:hypothetical protein [Comamonas sp. GB3 AK4-5]|uniref:hypothetical protein n=1 Tax=Comamonas sp. GB3 AK4-5 TaxID=3231487 RepID=UPI00351E48EA
MNAFLWTFLILESLSVAGRLMWLATGRFPKRTPAQAAVDSVAGALFCAWAACLLMELSHV